MIHSSTASMHNVCATREYMKRPGISVQRTEAGLRLKQQEVRCLLCNCISNPGHQMLPVRFLPVRETERETRKCTRGLHRACRTLVYRETYKELTADKPDCEHRSAQHQVVCRCKRCARPRSPTIDPRHTQRTSFASGAMFRHMELGQLCMKPKRTS